MSLATQVSALATRAGTEAKNLWAAVNAKAPLTALGLVQVTNPASPYNVSAADNGKHVYMTTTGRTVTIPANASVPLDVGTSFVVVNATGVSTTISITSDTLILSPAGTTGTRTLGAFGMATFLKVAATVWMVSGTALT